MAIEFVDGKNGCVQVNRKYIKYYHPAGEITTSCNEVRYNGFDIDDLETILSKMKELQNEIQS